MADVAVEISMYPLGGTPIPPIERFIERLNAYPALTVTTNSMSTQVSGPYDEVFDVLKEEIRAAQERDGRTVFVMKVLGGEW